MNLDAVKFDALYLVKLIFGKYFYFNANRVADLLQLEAIRVPVRERVNRKSRHFYSFVTNYRNVLSW